MIVASTSCSTKGSFDNIDDHWSIENGFYNNVNLNNVREDDNTLVFMSDMYFYKNKMFLHQTDNHRIVVNYELIEQVNEFMYKVRITCKNDSVDEVGFAIWDNLSNGIDRNGCEEMMFRSPNLNLYLWRRCIGNKSLLSVIDNGRDIDSNLLIDKIEQFNSYGVGQKTDR